MHQSLLPPAVVLGSAWEEKVPHRPDSGLELVRIGALLGGLEQPWEQDLVVLGTQCGGRESGVGSRCGDQIRTSWSPLGLRQRTVPFSALHLALDEHAGSHASRKERGPQSMCSRQGT